MMMRLVILWSITLFCAVLLATKIGSFSFSSPEQSDRFMPGLTHQGESLREIIVESGAGYHLRIYKQEGQWLVGELDNNNEPLQVNLEKLSDLVFQLKGAKKLEQKTKRASNHKLRRSRLPGPFIRSFGKNQSTSNSLRRIVTLH